MFGTKVRIPRLSISLTYKTCKLSFVFSLRNNLVLATRDFADTHVLNTNAQVFLNPTVFCGTITGPKSGMQMTGCFFMK